MIMIFTVFTFVLVVNLIGKIIIIFTVFTFVLVFFLSFFLHSFILQIDNINQLAIMPKKSSIFSQRYKESKEETVIFEHSQKIRKRMRKLFMQLRRKKQNFFRAFDTSGVAECSKNNLIWCSYTRRLAKGVSTKKARHVVANSHSLFTRFANQRAMGVSRGVDVNKRNVTTHSYS